MCERACVLRTFDRESSQVVHGGADRCLIEQRTAAANALRGQRVTVLETSDREGRGWHSELGCQRCQGLEGAQPRLVQRELQEPRLGAWIRWRRRLGRQLFDDKVCRQQLEPPADSTAVRVAELGDANLVFVYEWAVPRVAAGVAVAGAHGTPHHTVTEQLLTSEDSCLDRSVAAVGSQQHFLDKALHTTAAY